VSEDLWRKLLVQEGIVQAPMEADVLWKMWVDRYLKPWQPSARERERHAAQAERTRQRLRQDLAEQRGHERNERAAWEELDSHLTKDEVAQRKKDGYVDFMGSNGRRYRVYMSDEFGITDNVWEIDQHGCEIRNYCGAPEMYANDMRFARTKAIPEPLGYLGQVLTLRFNAEAFLAAAYAGEVWQCERQQGSG